jgi:hypothetical protein
LADTPPAAPLVGASTVAEAAAGKADVPEKNKNENKNKNKNKNKKENRTRRTGFRNRL